MVTFVLEDQETHGFPNEASGTVGPFTPDADAELAFLAFGCEEPRTVSSATWDGDAMTEDATHGGFGSTFSDAAIECLHRLSPSVGADISAIATFGGGSSSWVLRAITVKGGVDVAGGGVGAAVVANDDTDSGGAPAPTVNITTTQANSALLVVLVAMGTGGTSYADDGSDVALTELGTIASGNSTYLQTFVGADAGAVGTKTITLTNPAGDEWALIVVEVLAAAGAANTRRYSLGLTGVG
jgi:hypothetical protein